MLLKKELERLRVQQQQEEKKAHLETTPVKIDGDQKTFPAAKLVKKRSLLFQPGLSPTKTLQSLQTTKHLNLQQMGVSLKQSTTDMKQTTPRARTHGFT